MSELEQEYAEELSLIDKLIGLTIERIKEDKRRIDEARDEQ